MCGSIEFAERSLNGADAWIYTYDTTLITKVLRFSSGTGCLPGPENSTSTFPLRYILSPFQLHLYQAPKPNTHSMSHKEIGLNTQTKTCEELGTIKIRNIKP